MDHDFGLAGHSDQSRLGAELLDGSGKSQPARPGKFRPGLPGRAQALDELGMEGAIKGAFSFGIGASAIYDSNIYLTEEDEEDDVTFSITPSFSYTSDPEGGADIVLTASYSPSIDSYLSNSDFSGINHSGSATLTFRGSITEISIFGSASQYTGSDRLSGGFIDSGITTSAGIRATRQIAPRTSLNAAFTVSMSDYGDTVDSQPIAPVGPDRGPRFRCLHRIAGRHVAILGEAEFRPLDPIHADGIGQYRIPRGVGALVQRQLQGERENLDLGLARAGAFGKLG